MTRHRRTILAGAGTALSALLGGCVSDDTPSGSVGYDTFQMGAFRASRNPLNGATAAIDVFTTASAAREGVPLDDVDEGRRFGALTEGQSGTAEGFVETTAYDTEILVSVVSRWPKSNPSGVEVTDLARTDERITGAAVARGADPEKGDNAPTYPVALVRVAVGSERPARVEMTVTDGTGTETTVEAPVE